MGVVSGTRVSNDGARPPTLTVDTTPRDSPKSCSVPLPSVLHGGSVNDRLLVSLPTPTYGRLPRQDRALEAGSPWLDGKGHASPRRSVGPVPSRPVPSRRFCLSCSVHSLVRSVRGSGTATSRPRSPAERSPTTPVTCCRVRRRRRSLRRVDSRGPSTGLDPTPKVCSECCRTGSWGLGPLLQGPPVRCPRSRVVTVAEDTTVVTALVLTRLE